MSDDSLYVGYLPLPPRHARFLRVCIPVLLWSLVILNGAILLGARDPGPAAWNTDATVTLTGAIHDVGVPVLVTDEGETVLLVREGKLGPFDGPTPLGAADITGFILERGGRRVLEIAQSESERVSERSIVATRPRTLPNDPAITLRGEILDAKCFLGAMKPGDGKAHKACATLCIRGGIPAAVRIRTPDGRDDIALLVGPGCSPFPESLLEFIGEPVEFSGARFRIGNLDAIAVDPASVRRLAR